MPVYLLCVLFLLVLFFEGFVVVVVVVFLGEVVCLFRFFHLTIKDLCR